MRAALTLGLLASLPACGAPDENEPGLGQEPGVGGNATQRAEVRSDRRVIDAADALSPAEEDRLDQLARRAGQSTGRDVLVLTVPALQGQTLEQFGWAINGQRKADGTVMLMVRPDDRSVRVDSGGALSPEQAAAVAGSMTSMLAQKKTAPAIEAGLAAVGRLGASA